MVTHALAYAASGVRVFPCAPGAKTPVTAHGFHDATTDPDLIRAWWARTPNANVATPTGAPGIDVLDVDVRTDGSGWDAFTRAHAAGLVDGWIRRVRTPSGGMHLHYPGSSQRNGCLRGLHMDFRGAGGYVLLPHSVVGIGANARPYELVAVSRQAHRQLDWSAIVHEVAAEPVPSLYRPTWQAGARDPMPHLVHYVAGQREGNRDNALFWAACRAVEAGITELEPLVAAAVTAGLTERQARRTVRSAIEAHARGRSGRTELARPSSGRDVNVVWEGCAR